MATINRKPKVEYIKPIALFKNKELRKYVYLYVYKIKDNNNLRKYIGYELKYLPTNAKELTLKRFLNRTKRDVHFDVKGHLEKAKETTALGLASELFPNSVMLGEGDEENLCLTIIDEVNNRDEEIAMVRVGSYDCKDVAINSKKIRKLFTVKLLNEGKDSVLKVVKLPDYLELIELYNRINN